MADSIKTVTFRALAMAFLMISSWVTGGFITPLAAQESSGSSDLVLSQVDSSRLIGDQELDLYVRGTKDEVLSYRYFESPAGESPENTHIHELTPLEWERTSERPEGIHIFLLIDNSGSMYFDMDNEPTLEESRRRMTYARRALRLFLEESRDKGDVITMADFNLRYHLLVQEAESGSGELAAALDEITRPQGDEGFTELYESLWISADRYKDVTGRKVIILLSDGENYTYAANREDPHPLYGERQRRAQEVIEKLQEEEISLFSISFGEMEVSSLEEISRQTGGAVFDAADPEQLQRVYSTLRKDLEEEFLITCRAGNLAAEMREVRVADRSGKTLGALTYRLPQLFGVKGRWFTVAPFLVFLAALLARWLLGKYPWRSSGHGESLRVLHFNGSAPSQQSIPLEKGQTTIGWQGEEDLTLGSADGPADPEEHVDILYQEESGQYLLKSTKTVRVNNKPTQERILEAGDVISVDGTSIVIDLDS